MKKLLTLLMLSLCASAYAGPGDVGSVDTLSIPCAREASLAAFREALTDYELELTSMDGLRIQQRGVRIATQSESTVTLKVILGLTENGYDRWEEVQVVARETHDNACVIISAKIVEGN